MKKTIQQKRLDFLNDTVNHYNINNRCSAIIGGYNSCKYHPKSLGLEGISEGCAIGRKVGRRLALKLDEIGGSVSTIFEHLPKKLQELQDDFLMEVQELHDTSTYWNETGLSKVGKKMYNYIKDTYCKSLKTLQTGDVVIMPEPQPDDLYTNEFEGIVVGFRGDMVQVRDGNGDVWETESRRFN